MAGDLGLAEGASGGGVRPGSALRSQDTGRRAGRPGSGVRVLLADRTAAAEALLEDTVPPGRTH